MRLGVDTDFLVAVEQTAHPGHQDAYRLFRDHIDRQSIFVLAPQVLAEFLHVITDARRFSVPMEMATALERAEWWWGADGVEQAFPTDSSVSLSIEWMKKHRLGRKRILDTQLAALLHIHGVEALITNNHRDFAVFECFLLLGYS